MKSEVFPIGGGVFWDTSDLDSMTIFKWGGGVFWDTSDLDSMTIFIWEGGILGHLGFGLYDNFHWGGVFCGVWTKISTTPAGSCITDSLSHTTYVETNKPMIIGKSKTLYA